MSPAGRLPLLNGPKERDISLLGFSVLSHLPGTGGPLHALSGALGTVPEYSEQAGKVFFKGH